MLTNVQWIQQMTAVQIPIVKIPKVPLHVKVVSSKVVKCKSSKKCGKIIE